MRKPKSSSILPSEKQECPKSCPRCKGAGRVVCCWEWGIACSVADSAGHHHHLCEAVDRNKRPSKPSPAKEPPKAADPRPRKKRTFQHFYPDDAEAHLEKTTCECGPKLLQPHEECSSLGCDHCEGGMVEPYSDNDPVFVIHRSF